MNQRRWISLALAAVAALALLWGLWPAWTLWLNQDERWNELARQRQTMQAALQEAQTLQKKSMPSVAEAQTLIQSIGKQRLGATASTLPDSGIQLQLSAVSPQQLAQGWEEIRTQTSASLLRADLKQNAEGWSGTLVFKLAQKP